MSKKLLKKKILIAFGTRPELIKLLSLIIELRSNKKYIVYLCNTAQHKELLEPLLNFYKLRVHFDLNILKKNQSLSSITSKIISRFEEVLKKVDPNCVIVQGDTNTAFACALAAFYNKIKIIHIEAGLRTNNIFSPWPEEINRKYISVIADFNFAPTKSAKANLVNEGISSNKISITGNTVIDLLFITLEMIDASKKIQNFLNKKFYYLNDDKFKILLTAHRRENFGNGMRNIFNAINKISSIENTRVIYSIHPNPEVSKSEKKYLKTKHNILKTKNLNYYEFIYVMSKVDMLISDSGGIQEEAPSIGKPNLVLRDHTERPEAIKKNSAILVGANEKIIFNNFKKLYESKKSYSLMSRKRNLYGNGYAYKEIIKKLDKII